jgi:thiol-disulfide isomerase/thioredoxin
MYRTIFLFCILFTAFSLHSDASQVIISGSVQSNPNKEIVFGGFRIRSINDIGDRYSTLVDSSGWFCLSIPIVQTVVSRLEIGLGTDHMILQRVYLSPGDSVHVEINGRQVKFSGRGQSVLASRLYSALDSAGLVADSFSKALNQGLVKPNDFLPSIHDFRQRQYAFLQSDARFLQLNPLFVKLFNDQVEIQFRFLVNDLIHYLYFNTLSLPTKLLEYMRVREFTNDSYADNPEYIDLFGRYIWFGKQREILMNNSIQDLDTRKLIAYRDSLQGKTRDIVMADRICSDLSDNDFGKFDSMLIDAFQKVAVDKVAISTVKRSLFEFERRKELIGKPLHCAFSQTRLVDTLNNRLSFGEMLSSYKGKVVYLEVWSLGCGPCRAAMPYTRQMEKELSDLPIKFVYVTQDMNSKNLWNNIFTVSGTRDNHFRSIDGNSSSMNKFMNSTTVPWYMLFDKDGNVVDFNAPDPKEIKQILIELSKK